MNLFGINQAISQTITQLSCIQLETPSSRLCNFWWIKTYTTFNSCRTEKNCGYFAHDIFRCIFLKENICFSFVVGNKPLPEPTMTSQFVLAWWCKAFWSTLVQVMACYLPEASHLICNTLWNNLQWNLNQNTRIFFKESAFENVVCSNVSHFVWASVWQCLMLVSIPWSSL